MYWYTNSTFVNVIIEMYFEPNASYFSVVSDKVYVMEGHIQ